MNLFFKALQILDPLSGEIRTIKKFPFLIGASKSSDWRLNSSDQPSIALAINKKGNGYAIDPHHAIKVKIALDGAPLVKETTLPANSDCALTVGNTPLLLRVSPKGDAWKNGVTPNTFLIFSGHDGEQLGDFSPDDLLKFVTSDSRAMKNGSWWLTTPKGAEAGFPIHLMIKALQTVGLCLSASAPKGTAPSVSLSPISSPVSSNGSKGDFTCPVCWLKFDAGEIMSIATHDHLRGDPILGQDAKLRFIPNKFNDLGQALDAMGLPCVDLACPQCRRKLPPSFLELPNHIISLVGAPSAGKSYFLCTLIKTLASVLYKEFKLTFRDGDPSGNARLNEMKNQLFSARTPEQSFILKTDFEGIMYERLPRHGKQVALPRPFIFEIASATNGGKDASSLIFYDNAGEHFKPNVSLDDSPGALHVASSAGIMFLIDPTSNPHFRARLQGHHDPQLTLNMIDEQDTILAEMGVRIRTIAGLGARGRISTPLAIILGKCDVWEHLLGPESLVRPIHDGHLDLDQLSRNSERIRDLLLDVDPTLVAVAESISDNLKFFPVSSFGHSPDVITQGPNAGKLAPDPAKLSPRFVEIPMIWILSQLKTNGLTIPTSKTL